MLTRKAVVGINRRQMYAVMPLSNGFDNRFDNRVERTALFVQPDCSFNTVVKPVAQPGLTTGCIHDTAVCQTGFVKRV